MKYLTIVILALIPFISSCSKDNDINQDTQIREIAWNSLSDQNKSTVTIHWQEASVTETTYQGKDVYAVSFNTSDDALLGPIVVYIDKVSLVAIGQGLRM